jgi:hypothetical protein
VDKRFIFVEEKDEAFIRKKKFQKIRFLNIAFNPLTPPKIFLQKILPSREGEGD